MSEHFRWNVYADQPHNVAPKRERFRHHLRHSGSYVSLLADNLKKAVPVLSLYRKYRKTLFQQPQPIGDPFGLAISPSERNEEAIALFQESGVKRALVRIPSWEKNKLGELEVLCQLLEESGIGLVFALLQQRDDVLHPQQWADFCKNIFARFSRFSPFFEIGHAWNRTKWGIWDHKEYLGLAESSLRAAEGCGINLVGPAVIDFEFHLYPSILKKVPFDVVSSLFYVDRVGAPESKQFGWDAVHKLALLRAVVNTCLEDRPLWITEVNWPLEGTGKYSPAAGKPNVSEEEQADYLVRYYILLIVTGWVERIYWWQLIAHGYGLIDGRGSSWRKRSSFQALKTMVKHLKGSRFEGKIPHPQAEIFAFCRGEENVLVIWTKEKKNWDLALPLPAICPGRPVNVFDRDGREIAAADQQIFLEGSPKYVYYEKEGLTP
jgi:hypothetical protein